MRRNPNHYGSVSKMSGSRARPWIVRVSITDADGHSHQKAIGYAETREKAMLLLAEYNQQPWQVHRETLTFADLYQKWLEEKAPGLSKSNQAKLKTAYGWCSDLYGVKYMDLRSGQMQRVIDQCPRGYQTKEGINSLFGHLDRYAYELDIIHKMYSQLVSVRETVPESNRQPFTDAERKILWDHSDDRRVQIVLIFIYTGFRLMELLDLPLSNVNLKEWTITSGEKTAAGKGRVVPIWTGIRPFVKRFCEESTCGYLFTSDIGSRWLANGFHKRFWRPLMKELGMSHTPHEARHTFETMLDNAGVSKKCQDMLMGHKSSDVGTRVYTHKTLDQLRDAIEQLKR